MGLLHFDQLGPKKRRATSKIFAVLAVGLIISLGYTFASNISLNSGGPVEFGQGVAQSTACDNSILVTPYSSFVNAVGGGSFKFTAIKLSNVNSTNGGCASKGFTINVYDASGSSLALYSIDDNGTDFSSGDGNLTYDLNDLESSSVTLNIAGAPSDLVGASSVQRITIQSGLPMTLSGHLILLGNKDEIFSENGLFQGSRPLRYVDASGSTNSLTNQSGLAIQIRSGSSDPFTYGFQGVSGSSNNLSGMTQTMENGRSISYGSAITTLPIDVNSISVSVKNAYSLAKNGSYLKISTTITNTDPTHSINNISAQAGILDTMAGDDDVNFTRGNISNSGFNMLSNITNRSNSIIAHNGDVNAVLYSKSSSANSKWYFDCCDAYGLFDVSPSDSTIFTDGSYYDGSMALEYSIHDLAPGASYTFTWLIGGSNNADLSKLASILYRAGIADNYTP